MAFKSFDSKIADYLEKMDLKNMLVRKAHYGKLEIAHQIQAELESENAELEKLVGEKNLQARAD